MHCQIAVAELITAPQGGTLKRQLTAAKPLQLLYLQQASGLSEAAAMSLLALQSDR